MRTVAIYTVVNEDYNHVEIVYDGSGYYIFWNGSMLVEAGRSVSIRQAASKLDKIVTDNNFKCEIVEESEEYNREMNKKQVKRHEVPLSYGDFMDQMIKNTSLCLV